MERNNSDFVEEIATKKIKRIRESATNVKHPVYWGARMRNWGKWVFEIWGPARNRAYGLELSHDVTTLSIKSSSAILNFLEIAVALLRPVSLSPRDVQAAVAEAAAMQKFDLIKSLSSSSSSLSSLVCAILL
ncbi:Dehydration-responsive element-binding protein 3 [Forsythia ovata]|uniref:Dehydration-responsive element-binding protein 3 n=1 Tax=Forsythia ovata TaxID=205694 RepID=A0ABD1UBA0_9LAMI